VLGNLPNKEKLCAFFSITKRFKLHIDQKIEVVFLFETNFSSINMFVSSPQVKLGDNIRNIPTPALILDFESFSANLKKLPETLKQINSKVHFRPHAKAHKCPIIAQLQILSGAVGVCVQKV
jgi:hypothetical protein